MEKETETCFFDLLNLTNGLASLYPGSSVLKDVFVQFYLLTAVFFGG